MKVRYPIVVVHCIDQAYYGGTYDPRIKKFTPSEMCTVGHLIREDDKNIVLAGEYFSDHDVRYVSVIPKKDVVEMEVLREQDEN